MSFDPPILVGAGQLTNQAQSVDDFIHPVELMKRCAELAAEDAACPALLEKADAVHVVNIFSWALPNPPAALAEAVGAHPTRLEYTAIGGNSPQWLINRVADQLVAGRSRIALLAGCEVMRSVTLAAKAGLDRGPYKESVEIPLLGDERPGSLDVESDHYADLPVRVYPIIENALRAKEGLTLDEQRAWLEYFGQTYSRAAAGNPYAWFPVERTPEEIITPTENNRMIALPYTKYLNAVINVDQGAAVIMTTTGTARSLGIPETKWVYLHGGQDANDIWFVSHRPDLADSPAIRACVHDSLEQAHLTPGDITHFDFYSCFPCMPRLARDVLGIPHDDPRPMTLTGGLPYFGGPGSNYTMHAVAEAVVTCRSDQNARALITANGWYCTKHAAGIYAAAPPNKRWARTDPKAFQHRLPLPAPLEVDRRPAGPFTVDGYTVWHDRGGRPEIGILCGRTDAGHRAWAHTPPDDKDLLHAMMNAEWVGKTGRITGRSGDVNIAEF